MKWRFYTVPGDPAQPFESPALERAAAAWSGGGWWKIGGGGTVWDSMASDPELDMLYVGVGNGSPWNQQYRSPGGATACTCRRSWRSTPDANAYVWHYQTTPGDTQDFTATQHRGPRRAADRRHRREKVIMQAPERFLLRARSRDRGVPFEAMPMPTRHRPGGIDANGRPVPNAQARYVGNGGAGVPVTARRAQPGIR
ncbi:MAG: hypothetical protein IPO20_14125 [Gammaproteobacteria bacterium]|nr:hypothetical protein [Gammaproteobacteria bacterium]